MRILALSGSLKPTSTNSALLRAAAAIADPAMTFTFFESLEDIPHFRPDRDEEGMAPPPAVAAFRAALAECDGLAISCPEYAHGVPGAFKNALDWIVSSGELTDKPVALFMAGPGGAKQAWAALAPTLRVMGCNLVYEGTLVVAGRHFANGKLADAELEAELRRGLDTLEAAIR